MSTYQFARIQTVHYFMAHKLKVADNANKIWFIFAFTPGCLKVSYLVGCHELRTVPVLPYALRYAC